VATGELRTRAVADAWVVGVTAVDDGGLQIDAALADPSLRSGEDVPVPDDGIRTSLIKALTIDPLTRGSRIDPYVANGVVTLFGEASDLPSYRIAGEIAANTLGARWVRNRLEVNVAALPNDRELTNRVAQALVNDPFVDTTTIHVRARSGTAALTGEVQTEFKREHAVALAEAIHGVLTVENKIDVIYEPLRTTDPELRREIEDFLASVTGPSGEDVRLNVRHGIVTLSGSVDSEKTRERIESAAYASGARDVQDLMVIEPMRVAPVRMSGVSDEEP
jgi:osmotically-inducible protein OsmY